MRRTRKQKMVRKGPMKAPETKVIKNKIQVSLLINDDFLESFEILVQKMRF